MHDREAPAPGPIRERVATGRPHAADASRPADTPAPAAAAGPQDGAAPPAGSTAARAPGVHPLHALFHAHALDFWLARLAVAAVVVLQLSLADDLTLGPTWLAPALELAMLLPLAVATAWNQQRARTATTDAHWHLVGRHGLAIRRVAILLTGLVSVMNFGALLLLVRALLAGHAGGGSQLLVDAMKVWAINVVVFAQWYWSLDRGGPSIRALRHTDTMDFLFPQTTLAHDVRYSPGFVDYLFVSFTNATAFSPTDTLPLTPRAKLLMMAEAGVSLLTVALVAARAVNILA